MYRYPIFVMVLVAGIAGCAVTQQPEPSGKGVASTSSANVPGYARKGGAYALASPAVVALLIEAQRYGRIGDAGKAAANLERALRIEPENPWIWHRLAVLRLQQERWAEAITLAQKSNSLAPTHARRIHSGNWELIARAESGRGNEAASKQARVRSLKFLREE